MMYRIRSVDIFRFLAMMMIIVLHTQPFRTEVPEDNLTYQYLTVFITNAARFAVPFFFAVSGYFWGIRLQSGISPIPFTFDKLKRIFFIFLFWCLVYLIPYDRIRIGMSIWEIILPVREHLYELADLPLMVLLMQGTKLHLWYLVALMWAMAISAIFVAIKWEKPLIIFAILLFGIGVFSRGYADTPFHIPLGFNTLFGPFFSTLLFVSGYQLSKHQPNVNWLTIGGWIFLFGSLLHAVEVISLWELFGSPPWKDYVFGTYFMGLGFTMMALSDHPRLRSEILESIGKLTLGMYASHYIFVDLFWKFNQKNDSVIWELGYIVLVFVLSLGLTYLLSKIKFTRRFVI